MLAFARYFVEQAKANNMGTFYWMGLSDGQHRSVPEFNEADLKDAIIKGYYGDEGYQGITHIEASPSQPDACYSLSGHRLPAPQRGLNIIREADGTVRKVYRNP